MTFIPYFSSRFAKALLIAVISCSSAAMAVGDAKFQNATPLLAPGGQDGTWRMDGRYLATGWKFSGVQLFAPSLTKWGYDVIFDQATGAAGEISMPATVHQKILSGGNPSSSPWINAYLQQPDGSMTCFHIPFTHYWATDFLANATEDFDPSVNMSAVRVNMLDWVAPAKTPSNKKGRWLAADKTFMLRTGLHAGRMVRMYNYSQPLTNCDTRFDRPELCGYQATYVAVDVLTGQILRLFFVYPLWFNSYYLDFFDWTPANATSPSWKAAFNIPKQLQAVPCLDTTTWQPTFWNSTDA